jgi:hypothetical protein
VTTYAYDDEDHLVPVTDAEGILTTYTCSDRANQLLVDDAKAPPVRVRREWYY